MSVALVNREAAVSHQRVGGRQVDESKPALAAQSEPNCDASRA
jgi:hypothetical protein